MKKKAICLMTALVVVLAFSLCGCGDDKDYGGVAYGKKYVYEDSINVESEDRYVRSYMFRKNGTGEYRYELRDGSKGYVRRFKYTFTDDDKSGVVCFYDGMEFFGGYTDMYASVSPDWSIVLMVSQDIVMTTGGSIYVNESYARQLKNFNKKATA